MAVAVVMPRLGWTMERASVAEWLKHDGDSVRAGDVLFTVETDKVVQEVEAEGDGILRLPPDGSPPGLEVPVGAVLAYLVQAGEAAPFDASGIPASSTSAPLEVPSAGAVSSETSDTASPVPEASVSARVRPAASPRARRVAGELRVDWLTIAGSGRSGRIVERDVRDAAARMNGSRPRVTPVARRIALQRGVDIDDLVAHGPGARLRRADVEAAVSASETGPDSGRRQPLTTARRLIGERMSQSVHATAAVTLTTEADATELVALRERTKRALAGSARLVPTYTDLFVRLLALALLDHPRLNSALDRDVIIQHDSVHIGIAVDTEQALLVPVLRDAQRKSIQTIAAESSGLIARARAGTSSPDELRGSTFTVTNLGMYEIDAFTPIINVPECAILGLGRIVSRQVVVDEDRGEVAVRKMMALSLTFDHRVVDGAPAARFLQQIKRWVGQPDAWLTA